MHKEAFALMWYACDCGHRERIWNSRDGVTPFGMTCPSCGGYNLLHVDWQLDECAPEHKLARGQRFWRDGTADEAVTIIKRRVARHSIPENIALLLLEDARNQTEEWSEGWSMLDGGGGHDGCLEGLHAVKTEAEVRERNRQLESALVALIDAVDTGDKTAIERALFVGRGLTF